MADFGAVLRKTLEGLGETTPAVRARVYDKARDTISRKLAALDPQPPAAVAERQRQALEEAIASVEAAYAPPKPAADPLDELESVFSSIETQRQAPPPPRAAPPKVSEPPLPPQSAAPAAVAPASGAPAAVRPPPPMPRAVTPARLSTPAAAELRRPSPPPPPSPMDEEPENRDEEIFDREPQIDEGGWRSEAEAIEEEERPRRRGFAGRLVAALLVLALLGGGGYAAWRYGDDLKTLVAGFTGGQSSAPAAGSSGAQPPKPAQPDAAEDAPAAAPAAPAAPASQDVAAADPDDAPAQEPGAQAPAQPPKFNQRLNADGSEVDAGQGAGAGAVGEGTSVAQATPPADPNAAPGAAPGASPGAPAAPGAAAPPAAGAAAQPGVAVAQRAIFYEERTNVAPASAETGQIVWSTVQESPGGDLPPEAAIRAEATIPGKDMQLRMTIRRNGDRTLPASHIIEMIFLNAGSGESIDNVLRVSFKSSEQDPGTPLLGNSAKIADGYFLVALDDGTAQSQANLNLMRQGGWIDVPIVYKSGRRALFTMEKGIPGDKAFGDALTAWQSRAGG